MKIKFCGPQHVPAIDVDGEHEVVESQLLHRFSLVDGVCVDKYPGKTDAEIAKIEYDQAAKLISDAQKEYDKLDEEAKAKSFRPESLPAFNFRGE